MMKIKHLLLLYFGISIAIFSCSALQTKTPPSISVSKRVDTNNADIRSIIQLYSNYLNSSPELIQNNPYWNSEEKKKFKDFDLSRATLFQSFTGEEIQRYFPPFILSIEPVDEKYRIKVLYSSNTTEPAYIGSKVWAIHQLFTVKENNKWVLENSLQNVTSGWNTFKTKHITFHYPFDYDFSEKRAQKANEFCAEILKEYNLEHTNYHFNYYIANDIDQMGQLENFDYYFTGITTGKSKEQMVISCIKDEFYPHEFIHQLLPENPNRSHIIEEGLATFLGTKVDITEYQNRMKLLSDDVINDSSTNFHSIFDHNNPYKGYQVAYPAGAALCELVFELKGEKGLNVLINGNTSTKKELTVLLTELLNLTEHEIETKWNLILTKFDQN